MRSDNKHPLDPQLDQLFAAYREATENYPVSSNFAPVLWQRIEARRDALQPVVRRLTQLFAGLAAAASFALIALTLVPQETSPLSYVEILAQRHTPERVLYQEVATTDSDQDPDHDAIVKH
jgi:hypothetical protein